MVVEGSGAQLPAVAVNELLHGPVWCLMFFAQMPHQREGRAELRMQRIRVVAYDRQTAALQRAVLGERRHDDMTARLDRAKYGIDVRPTRFRVGQEVENGAVMPDVVGVRRQRNLRDVAMQPAR